MDYNSVVRMATKEDLKKVYLDTSVILPWFQNILQNKKDGRGHIETPRIIQFLVDHPEIEKFISYFTIAEIVEELLFKTDRIKDYMKRLEHVKAFVEVFQQTIPNLSIIPEDDRHDRICQGFCLIIEHREVFS